MVVNAIDLTDDAKSRFESKLKGLVGVDDNPKELKYKPCDEAQREPPPTPPLPIAIATELPSVSTHDGGVVLFGDVAPFPHSEVGSSDAPACDSDPPQGAGGEKRASSDTDGSNDKPPKKVSSPAHRHNNAAAHEPPALCSPARLPFAGAEDQEG